MPASEYPISLVIRAIDKATEPLRQMNAKIAAFNAPFKKLGGAVKEFGEMSGLTKLGESTKELGKSFREVGTQAFELGEKLLTMEAVGVFAIYEILKASVEAGSKLSEMAQRTGLSVDAYAQLQFAAGQAHVTQEQFNDAMDKFNMSLGEAKAGTGPLLDFLNKVSPALARQVRGAKSTEDALGLMTRAFEKLKDPAKIAALTQAAFGRGSKNLGQFLHQGSAAIDEQRKRYFALAGSQSEFAEQSEEAEKALNETGAAFTGLRNAAATQLMPALSELAKTLANFLAAHREGIAKWAKETGAAISKWVEGGGLQRLGKSLEGIGVTLGKVVDALGGFKGVLVLVGAYMVSGFVGSLLTLGSALFSVGSAILPVLITAFGALGPVLEVLGGIFFGTAGIVVAAVAAVGLAAYEIYKNWGGIKFFFKDLWGSIVWYAKQAWDKISPVVDKIIGFAKMVGGGIKGAVQFVTGGDSPAPAGSTPAAPPPLAGATAAAPGAAGRAPAGQDTQAKVVVDFKNTPKGVRVTPDSDNTAPLDLNLGYTMVGG